ncbi:MAG: hypothetical protein CG438_9 [Methylococcaceae bacterium NSP1-1]|jgi:hypothetical protein|nr:hypothetical protein [Methylococcaceae bacterium]OYV21988.1 MAG: hypothetical protein CG438_9 [Methylococcaceae bacterium NSP1-1]OYV23621.1 MAG: hypothetical protein CG442_9 [Methylococcaceae bacterium NSO1]MDD1628798.1 hypothetical protein [Methylococcaceae bacterium]MDD1634903.1 hypothetical protein [Methylococcaceae bacterium]
MKKLPALLLILSSATLIACGKGQEINGHNTATAYRSVKALKNRLSPDNRIEFEVSFWTIRDAKKDDKEFLDVVDGKTPEEIIAIGKEIYQERKAAGFKGYEEYSSWEEMIAKFGKERMDQDNRKGKSKEAQDKDKANDVLYKL